MTLELFGAEEGKHLRKWVSVGVVVDCNLADMLLDYVQATLVTTLESVARVVISKVLLISLPHVSPTRVHFDRYQGIYGLCVLRGRL